MNTLIIEQINKLLGILGVTSISGSAIYYGYLTFRYGSHAARKALKLIKRLVILGIIALVIYFVMNGFVLPNIPEINV